tara:strand:- start:175 stop:2439 length:2265 start_codon:yes stop_codon:yes gene_type:complete
MLNLNTKNLLDIFIKLLVIVNTICIFMPYINKNKSWYNGILDKNVFDCYYGRNNSHIIEGSEKIHYSTIVLILLIPIVIVGSLLPGMIQENITMVRISDYKKNFNIHLLKERYIISFMFVLPSVGTYIMLLNNLNSPGLFFIACYRAEQLITNYVIITIIKSSQSDYLNIKTMEFYMILYVIASIIFTNLSHKKFILASIFITSLVIYLLIIIYKYRNRLYKTYSMITEKQKYIETLVIVCLSYLLFNWFVILFFALYYRRLLDKGDMELWRNLNICRFLLYVYLITAINRTTITRMIVLREREESLTSFIKQISHEARTPINITQMGLDNMKDMVINRINFVDSNQKNEILDILDDCIESVDVSIGILNDILQMEKLISGIQEYEMIPVSLGKLIKTTCNILNAKASYREINFDYNVCDNEECINTIMKIDPTKISVVLRNLVTNAIKFTKKGGNVIIKILFFVKINDNKKIYPEHNSYEIDIEQGKPNFVRIEVIDDGIGLSKNDISKLLDKPMQIDPNKNQNGGGSGFGLLISKKIVLDHGGEIGIKSDGEFKGSTFYFDLPIIHPEELDLSMTDKYNRLLEEINNDKTSNRSIIIRNSLPYNINKLKEVESNDYNEELRCEELLEDQFVLVVDDSTTSVKMVVKALESFKIKCITSENGKEAVDNIKENMSNNKIRMIFMDNNMPVMSGMEATKQIRELGYTNPILGLTGALIDKDIKDFIDSGSNEVLAKPLKRNILEEKLCSYGLIVK